MSSTNQLSSQTLAKLRKFASSLKIRGRSKLRKADLIQAIEDHLAGKPISFPRVSTKTKKKSPLTSTKDVDAIITITCGDVAENHIGNQQIGHLVAKGQGFKLQDLQKASRKFKNMGYKVEIFDLNKGLDGVEINGKQVTAEPAHIMVIRNGVEALIGSGKIKDFYNQLVVLDWDKKFWDARRKKVLNKHARHNLCFSKKSQDPDYKSGKGRIVAYDQVPHFQEMMSQLPNFFGKKAKTLQAEGNKYFNKKKTGIGYHGDTERRKVIAWRLGEGDYGDPRATMPIHWQWYINSKPVGQNMKFMINGGDIYVMSEKATGQDWKKKVRSVASSCPSGCRKEPLPTLRHAAGSVKYTTVRIKK
jgi:hypothetical protein